MTSSRPSARRASRTAAPVLSRGGASVGALRIPLIFTAALTALSFLPSVASHPRQAWAFWGAASVLIIWGAVLLGVARARGRRLQLEVVLRAQHYLQATVQLSVFLYWGWYFEEVYKAAPLILAQLCFAYAFDMLLAWSRRDRYTLGFGQFPVIFSINLFLWFKADWFHLQFVMVAVGFLAKEFIRWQKDGRSAHIFNPSSFPLGLFALGLILTSNTAMTWGQEIANTFERPPYIRLWIFLIGLPGQYLFGVTTMTMSAVMTVFLLGFGHQLVFGTPFFVDAYVPAAVFLGMHLLFTDPSTSPRSDVGRVLFGITYGACVVTLFSVLGALGIPTFYDKLMAVPLMNLAVRRIDQLAASPALQWLDPKAIGRALAPRQRHLRYIGVWAIAFLIVSDPFYLHRPRRWVPFWQNACARSYRGGCETLGRIVTQYCRQGSGWACNEAGILASDGAIPAVIPPRLAFEQACGLGSDAACANQRASAPPWRRQPPTPTDLRVLLQEGQGPVADTTGAALAERACRQGWLDACDSAN